MQQDARKDKEENQFNVDTWNNNDEAEHALSHRMREQARKMAGGKSSDE